MRDSHWDYVAYLGAATWLGTVIYVCESPQWKAAQHLQNPHGYIANDVPAPVADTPLSRINGETLDKLSDHELDTPEGFQDPFLEKHSGGPGNADPVDRK